MNKKKAIILPCILLGFLVLLFVWVSYAKYVANSKTEFDLSFMFRKYENTYSSFENTESYTLDDDGALTINKTYFSDTSGKWYRVTSVADGGFKDHTEITQAVLPESITTIGNNAFDGCSNLATINLPNSITNMGNYAFQHTAITSVKIPSGIKSLSAYAFAFNTALKTVTFTDETTHISQHAFQGCTGLTTINFPNTLIGINWSAFQDCSSLEEVTLPDSITTMGNGVFYGCTALEKINIPTGMTTVVDSTFSNCTSLVDVKFHDNITSIGSGAFAGTGFTNIEFPDSITTMGSTVLMNCKSLTDVKLPANLTQIGRAFFFGCSSLVEVFFPDTLLSMGTNDVIFQGADKMRVIYYKGSDAATADWWADSALVINDQLTVVPKYVSGDFTNGITLQHSSLANKKIAVTCGDVTIYIDADANGSFTIAKAYYMDKSQYANTVITT